MTTRCLEEWGESHFEVCVSVGDAFQLEAKVDAFSIFQVAAKLARGYGPEEFDAVRIMRADIGDFWCITFEQTATSPHVQDKIIAEYYVRRVR